MTLARHCSIIEFGRGTSNQAVAPGITRPLHATGSTAACEYGAEEQTIDYIVLHCPIHRPPHGLHILTVLDDETIE